MAMNPQLYTQNGIATELNIDCRKVARALRGVTPDGRVKKRPAWHLSTAMKAIAEHDKREGRNYGRANSNELPPLPYGIKTDDPVTGLAVLVGVMALEQVSQVAAELVAAFGGNDAMIFACARFAPAALRKRLAEEFEKSGLDPSVLPENVPAAVDWPRLEKFIKRKIDLDGAHKACIEAFAA